MSWPRWIEELRQRYLANEASVFLLTGQVEGLRWYLDGESLDCVGVLRAFLAPTREVLGILRTQPEPSGMEFAGIADRVQFENLVKSAEMLRGKVDIYQESDPYQAMSKIWRALSTTGTDQAYIIRDIDALLPAQRQHIEPLPGAPPLPEWPTNAALRASNNIVLLLTADPATVRADLVEAATQIVVDDVIEPQETLVPAVRATPSSEELRPQLVAHLNAALAAHPVAHRAGQLPVMDAVARAIADHVRGVWGPLSFSLGEDDALVVDGPRADRFKAAWRGDIALSAAAGMILGGIEGPVTEDAPPALDETGLVALMSRIRSFIERQ